MEPFATVDDYEARYGDVEDPERVGVLLGDASMRLRSFRWLTIREDDEVQAANLKRIACAAVHRSIVRGNLEGLSGYTQSAGDYSASVTVANPDGNLYFTGDDLRSLGYGTGRIGNTDPYSHSGAGDAP